MVSESQGQTPRWTLPLLGAALVVLLVTLAYGAFGGRGARPEVNVTEAADGAPSIEALQQATVARPNDPDAWARFGMALYDRDDYAGATTAFEHATALAPTRGNLWSLLGETRIYASARDPMPAAAVEAFQKALAIDPKDPAARYFMAVRRDLAKDHPGAIADMLALLHDTPPGAPWESNLRRTIEQIGQINHIDVASRLPAIQQPAAPAQAALPGPSPDQIRDAARLSPSDQDSMARGMVESLEGKLKADPKNVTGWIMLIRSRMTLGEPAKASAAYQAAVAANPEAKDQLESEARSLGVPFPYRGTPISRGLRRITTVYPYVIRYRIRGERIEILRVFHGARNVRSKRVAWSPGPRLTEAL
jgi:cytochrome c-type biogenesis protein CcmH